MLLAAEALRDVPTDAVTVTTPLGPADGRVVRADVVVVPVLRAGLGMLEAVLELVPRGPGRPHRPAARRGDRHRLALLLEAAAGPRRQLVLMIDPMLATGGSAVAGVDLIKAPARAPSA